VVLAHIIKMALLNVASETSQTLLALCFSMPNNVVQRLSAEYYDPLLSNWHVISPELITTLLDAHGMFLMLFSKALLPKYLTKTLVLMWVSTLVTPQSMLGQLPLSFT
jgi:hypothetical protein